MARQSCNGHQCARSAGAGRGSRTWRSACRARRAPAGTISLKNLRRVAKELGENMTDDELQEVIDFCDKDGRGEILLEDFCSVLLAAQAQQQLAADALNVQR